MAYINDYVLDLALSYIDISANRLDICSTEPTNFSQATSSLTLGNKTGISVSAPTNRTPDGRKVTVSAITDGTITGNGTAAFWAITDTANSRLVATGSLGTPQVVTSPNTFTLQSFDIGIKDAVNA
jgi:hypothetical protein